jgi:hypothetical protein
VGADNEVLVGSFVLMLVGAFIVGARVIVGCGDAVVTSTIVEFSGIACKGGDNV